MPEINRTYTVTEASAALRVSRQTIYTWLEDGRIQYLDSTILLDGQALDQIRHERVVEAGRRLQELQAIPRIV